jgi:FKBP-type peptidyl-prolyl cis-trans isomerase
MRPLFNLSILASCLISGGLSSTNAALKSEIRQARAAEKAFLEKNKSREGITTTRSGLQYEILAKGDSDQLPRPKDIIEIHYHGTLSDGTVFDSSLMRGQTMDIRLWDVIPGWVEGIKLMSPGDKYRFYIPSNLAYGSKGNGVIPRYTVLIFEIELVALKEKTRGKRKK